MSEIIFRDGLINDARRSVGANIVRELNDPYVQAGVGAVAIAGVTAASSIAVLSSMFAELAIRGSYELKFARNMTGNVISTMLTLSRYYFGNEARIKPAAVIGGIPLGTVTELSHAMSDRTLKFRSRGGIFLAHQEGGEQTLRITGLAWGPNRFWFLVMLDFLFLYGQASTHDMFAKGLIDGNLVTKDIVKDVIPEDKIKIDPWAKIDRDDLEDGIEESHLTFPIVTRNRVYNNMYIETYDYREAVEIGRNVIEYTLFFRKYIPPIRYKYIAVQQEGRDHSTKIVHYYREDGEDIVGRRLGKLDLFTDLGFSTAILFYRSYIIANKNSVELNTAMTFGININKQVRGDQHEELSIYAQYDSITDTDDLVNLSTKNKEELFVLV